LVERRREKGEKKEGKKKEERKGRKEILSLPFTLSSFMFPLLFRARTRGEKKKKERKGAAYAGDLTNTLACYTEEEK